MSAETGSSQLLLVGWDFRTAALSLREKLAFSPDRAREALARLTGSGLLSEGVIVSTCNRSEIYGLGASDDSLESLTAFVSEFQGVEAPEIASARYLRSGEGAARHLFRVAAGLESLAVGENQILAQVREAFHLAVELGATRSVMHRLFQKAMQAGKRVRTETDIGTHPISIPSIAFQLARKVFGDIQGRSILQVGAGETALLFLDLLRENGVENVTIVNRSLDHARHEAAARGFEARPWEDLPALLRRADIVATATGSSEPIISAAQIATAQEERRGTPFFLIDLAVPRDIEAAAASLYNVFLYTVDDLAGIGEANRAERLKEIPRVETILEEELAEFLRWYESLAVVPTVTSLRRKVERLRDEELDRTLAHLRHLGEDEHRAIRRLADALIQKILHTPTVRLKDEVDPARKLDRLEAIRHLFGLDEEERK
jgi:glutamyl-tRNA reductase